MKKAIPSNPGEALARAMGTYKREFEWGEDELDMVKYSVINNQTRLRKNYGVVELHITSGLDELQAFQIKQTEENRLKNPYFLRLDKDMSGRQKLHLYLWRKYEQQSVDPKGLDLITKIDIVRR
jgi:hypothetical protein